MWDGGDQEAGERFRHEDVVGRLDPNSSCRWW